MKAVKNLALFILVVFCFVNTVHSFADNHSCNGFEAREDSLSEYKVIGNKIYIKPEQLHFTDNSIFIFIQGEQVFLQQLCCDNEGIFCFIECADSISNTCPNGHRIWCKRWLGCGVRYCLSFRCRCITWENR